MKKTSVEDMNYTASKSILVKKVFRKLRKYTYQLRFFKRHSQGEFSMK